MLYSSFGHFFSLSDVFGLHMKGAEEDEEALELYREHANKEALSILENTEAPVFFVKGLTPFLVGQSLPAIFQDETRGFILINADWVRAATQGNLLQRWACKRVLSKEIASHELTHVDQYERGDFVIDDSGIYWKGRRYRALVATLTYPLLPWEREAHRKGWQSEGRNISLSFAKLWGGFVGTAFASPILVPLGLIAGTLFRRQKSD